MIEARRRVVCRLSFLYSHLLAFVALFFAKVQAGVDNTNLINYQLNVFILWGFFTIDANTQ